MTNSIAQRILKSKPRYIEYDFDNRELRRTLEGKTQMQRDIAMINLLDFRRVALKHGLHFWLMFGTLLGSVRERNFIEHDTDTDLAVSVSDQEALIATLSELLANGFDLIRTKEPDDLVTIMRNDEYIDIGIFRSRRDLKGKRYNIYQNHVEYGEVFRSFIEIEFLNTKFYIPKNFELLLSRWYGDDWDIKKIDYPAMVYDRGFTTKLIQRVGGRLNRWLRK